jgi:hypothetical protein
MLSMRAFAALALIAFAAACSGEDGPSEAVLRAEAFAEGAYLKEPTRLMVRDSDVVVLDRWAPMIHVIGRRDGRRIASFGREGSGPGEFRVAMEVQPDPRDPHAFWVYDMGLGRLTRLTFSGADTVPETGPVVSISNVAPAILQPLWLSDTSLVATGLFPRGRLITASQDGKLLATIGETPSHPGGEAVPVTVVQHAYSGPLTVAPDRTRLAVGTRHADRLEIFAADGRRLREVTAADGWLPVFETRYEREGVSMATGADLRFGFVGLASNDDFIFALFSGDRRGDAPGKASLGKEIRVYAWNGTHRATLALPERAVSIAVDPHGRELYAIHDEPEPRIARYHLPPLGGRR